MRLKHIDILRGIAALSVTIFHLTGSSGLSKPTGLYGKYGYVGVEMFFVISGFVLPYSLYKSGYRLSDCFTFVFKRLVRIYPPYLVAILVAVVVTIVFTRTSLGWPGFLLHLLFLNTVFGYPDISPVIWTLKVELMFYFFIGVTFNHIFMVNKYSIGAILLSLILPFLLTSSPFIAWLPLFALGILIYNKMFTGLQSLIFWPMSVLIIAIIYQLHGLGPSVGAAVALMLLIFWRLEYLPKRLNDVWLYLGAISYSLYLLHWEIGRGAVAFSRHLPIFGNSEVARVVIGILVALIAASLLNYTVEKPTTRFANSIKYRHRSSKNISGRDASL